MADCMYHGQSSPGPCGMCQIENERGMKEGSLPAYDIGNWRPEESDRAAGLMPLKKKKKKKSKR